MKLGSLFVFCILCLSVIVSNASTTKTSSSSSALSKNDAVKNTRLVDFVFPELFFNYYDFKYDSTSGANYNRYQGHSRQYGIAGNAVSISKQAMFGAYIYQVDSKVNTQFSLAPGQPFTQTQNIKSDTLLLRFLKRISYFAFDASGAIGRNRVDTSLFMPSGPASFNGFGSGRNNQWYVSLAALFYRDFKQYYIRGDARVLYSEDKSGNYQILGPQGATIPVQPLSTKASWIMENVEAGYRLTPKVTPFVRGGLVQVVSYRNSRALITSPFLGTLPQLNNNKNAYRIGGGVSLRHSKLELRLEQQYYRAGSVYTSNQTFVKLTFYTD